MQELESMKGTGQDGRVSKKDVMEYIASRRTKGQPTLTTQASSQQSPPMEFPAQQQRTQSTEIVNYTGNVEIIEMDRMRKLIAKHMIDSTHTSAHVTSFAECDVTNLVLWREKIKKEFEKREGEKITFTPLFVEAIVKCIKKYPWLNSSVDGDKIIVKKDINIGMATAMPGGNLIVPVIKNADQLNLVGLTKQVNGLANAARNNKLKPDDTSGGTFTLTNVGTFGSIMGTPIINQPQVAIMAVGAIKKRPVVIETAQGDSIAIRHMMYISLSYDHRIIDGALGSTFLNAVAKELENFDGNRSI
jgi:2-oxoglutarate dehydrogenase E2 component (dihydrolipoamide succinyltransferase)